MTRGVLSALLASVLVWQPHSEGFEGRSPETRSRQFVERQAYLMGTRVRLVARGGDAGTVRVRLEKALAGLEDSERELSTWRPDSQLSMFNLAPVGTPWMASERLCAMFAEVFEWQRASSGAFDPAVGALADLWKIHDGGRVPSPSDLSRAMARTGSRWIDFDSTACTLTRRAEVTIDVGAFGKGEALDRAAAVLGDGDWMVDLGGQVSVGGSNPERQPWEVDLADPLAREVAVVRVRLSYGSLATSGGSERDLHVAGRRVGHLLDPRTGEPAPFAGSVAAWHERAIVADMLSTALYVMGPDEGLQWAEARGLAAAYLIPDRDRVRLEATPEFERRVGPLARP